MIDVAIIGGGPAALSAGLNCRQRNASVCIFGRSIDSSLLYAAEEVDNYLGMPNMTGEDMTNAFFKHAMKNGVEFKECRVSQIIPMGEYFLINAENEFHEAKAIILCTGINKSHTITGERDLLGKGVSYCATCDGMLYRGKKVVVVAENPEGEEEANFLADVCESVTYIPKYKEVSHLKENIIVKTGKVKAVLEADGKVSGIQLDEEVIPCDGAFFAKNSTPPDSLVVGLSIEGNAIVVNRKMETNIPMVYAAGDCTGVPYQIAKAVGEGLIAALSAVAEVKK
ncbi:NAD(P)/FAD-dependent oxidoreductase [Chakrabartyella piscis]|uniref:NAD(P)/FAD-dependent oxidoreductase n=1 Tax=Chakrabartyella piscis TaxID=2918914 RepID=UPI002958D9BC|nr:NAD(P)/FAD-dependent oxidoreductase [Chakrabartyella piscis]